MSKTYRYIMLSLSFVFLITVGLVIEGNLNDLTKSFWFSSGLLLLVLLSLVDQPFFSKDSNIFVNAITAGVSLLLVPIEDRNILFIFFTGFILYLASISYVLMLIRQNPLKEENKAVQFFSRFNRIVGKPDVIFSMFFLWGAITQYTSNSPQFNKLLLFWIIFTLLNVPELARVIEKLFEKKDGLKDVNIGIIFGVQSQNTFLVKLNKDCKNTELFDIVGLKYSVDGKIYRGLVFEKMLLDQEQWVKVITNKEISVNFEGTSNTNYADDFVYKIDNPSRLDFVRNFVGIITDDSHINKVKFLFNSKVKVSEGNILEILINDQTVLYQIIEGKTHIGQLSKMNQTGFIVGEAIQLGTWDKINCQFLKFGWVPEINTPLHLASNIETPELWENEFIIGVLPGTNYPVIINKEIAITHHMAVIGVTGTGKSVFSRNVIREYLKDDNVKVICIDFTGEYKEKFIDLNPSPIIADEKAKEMFTDINIIESQMESNYNKDTPTSREKKIKLYEEMCQAVNIFISDDTKQLSIFELPEVQNTTGVMKYTQVFFKALFKIAKENNNHGKRVCLVLEEAHTIIPEWNFAGISDKVSLPLINSIAQIALQGRKYNIGLLVIAQRTANVSKTILTQCNSIISFQEYDKTSTDFLANYFGNEIAATLPKLKFRQAVAAGKAFRSNVPMIFDVPEIPEITEQYVEINPEVEGLPVEV
jgi:Cdc6-like AAA superfamily ATPase